MRTNPDDAKWAAVVPFGIAVRPDRLRIVVALEGELDLATVDRVDEQIAQLRTAGFTSIVLDLRALTFIDATGLRLLLRLDAASRSDGFAFAIIDGCEPVRRLLAITGLTDRFERAAPIGNECTDRPLPQ